MPTVWPFLPNLRRSDYIISREYSTEIIVSRSGKEQARANRQTPRKRIEYVAGQTEDCLREFNRYMVTAQREQLAIPDRVRYVRLTAELPGGNTTIIVDPLPSWLVAGARLMLVDGTRHGYRTVAGIVGTSVTFNESDADVWPVGTRLHPALIGYLDATIGAPLLSQRGVIEASIVFHVDPGIEDAEEEGSAVYTLGGREVFLTRPDRWAPIRFDRFQDGRGKVDFGHGRVSNYFPVEFSSVIWEASYTGCDFDAADALRQFFDRMDGRRGEFYMPTFLPDLAPTAGVTAAGTTLAVSGDGLEAAYDGNSVYSAIALKKKTGGWITRTVSSVVDGSGSGATITVGAAWGENVALGNIAMVCWLPVWRFASDILTTNWKRDTVATVKMSFQIIENLAVEA